MEKIRAIIEEDEAYEYALEIALEWWIKNTSEASWKTLLPMIYRCGEIDTADQMMKTLSKYAIISIYMYIFFAVDEFQFNHSSFTIVYL